MLDSFDKILTLPDGEDRELDLDLLAEKLDGLSGEVSSYRESLIRHIASRRELLGKPEMLDSSSGSIQQLLELKTEIDREFRDRFRIRGDFFSEKVLPSDNRKISRFHCGR